MENDKSFAASMKQTIEYGNFEFLSDLGEFLIDAAIKDNWVRDIPVLGSIVGVGKCIKNVYDACFAKKLIAFLIPFKDVSQEKRAEAIDKW